MAFSNYTDLQAAVLSFNWARDTGSVADFIMLAHKRINLGLRVPFMEKTTDLTISSQRIAVPTDFAAIKRLWIDDSYDTPLAATSPERIAFFNSNYSSGQRPLWYAVEGDFAAGAITGEFFVFAPNPGATTYTGKLLYTQRLTPLSAGGDTNVVLDRYPNLYLYGALWEAASYSDDDSRVAKYMGMFLALLRDINMQANLDAHAGSALVMTSPYAGRE